MSHFAYDYLVREKSADLTRAGVRRESDHAGRVWQTGGSQSWRRIQKFDPAEKS